MLAPVQTLIKSLSLSGLPLGITAILMMQECLRIGSLITTSLERQGARSYKNHTDFSAHTGEQESKHLRGACVL